MKTATLSKILDQYNQLIGNKQILADPVQLRAIEALAKLAAELESEKARHRFFWQKKRSVHGLYLYGPVGRGKSMLMDLFYKHVAIVNKQRLHFHHFMAWVHERLRALQGTKNPMRQLAKDYAKNTRLLCFDEFFVSDIGDAMIMARLFEALFAEGVVLVATSNCHPQQLYRNGLQRARFEPTIALLESHCQLCDVSGEQDYRLHGFKGFRHFIEYQPERLLNRFSTEQNQPAQSQSLLIHNRAVRFQAIGEYAACIDFFELCGLGRSSADYMVLAQRFDVLYVDNVPMMGLEKLQHLTAQGIEEGYIRERERVSLARLDDEARRFIALVDEFYDTGKLIVIAAQGELTSLYQGERLAFEFARTQSRLIEMQRWPLTTVSAGKTS
ncbi:cell division protein ZapE [Pseudoalteromonas sp. T1lg48]|uniref:cell division protein ZapE n=1 Tax=Pseudoalteromonas sp. T1lg48 TaxID=2077100 RepID=UPI001EEEE866|nr:cell division protein ZapE [Pseudoalteromonas sp. T1lg48]